MTTDEDFNIEGLTPAESCETLFLSQDLNGLVSMSASLIQQARRQVCIYSPQLDVNLFGQPTMVDACSGFARSDRFANLKLLVNDSEPLIQQSHPLVRLQQRLCDKIELRCLPKDFDPDNMHKLERSFIVTDQTGLMLQHTTESWDGFINFDDKPNAREFAQLFSFLWKHAEIIKEIQRLGL